MCAPVVNRDVNQLELGRRPWSSPTLDLGRRSRVEEREVDPESGDYERNSAWLWEGRGVEREAGGVDAKQVREGRAG